MRLPRRLAWESGQIESGAGARATMHPLTRLAKPETCGTERARGDFPVAAGKKHPSE